jgi:hypothetical protein
MSRSTFSWLRHQLEVSSQLRAPVSLPLGKDPRCSLYRRLGGSRICSGRYREVNILNSTGTRTPTLWSVAIPTALSRLSAVATNGLCGYIAYISGRVLVAIVSLNTPTEIVSGFQYRNDNGATVGMNLHSKYYMQHNAITLSWPALHCVQNIH